MEIVLFKFSLVVATLLSCLVAGFLFAFAIVVMPGIGQLKDEEFVRAFQRMDGIIQKNQPVFMLVWVGSIVMVFLTLILGYGHLSEGHFAVLVLASLLYLGLVQVPTFVVNVPLNNQIQAFDTMAQTENRVAMIRLIFERRWNRWHVFRTIFACVSSLVFLTLLIDM